MPKNPHTPMSAKEAADILRVSPRTIQRRAKAGTLDAVKLPGETASYLFDRDYIESLGAGRAS